MHNPKSELENEMHQILLHFEIEMDHLILVRRPDLMIVQTKKRTWRIVYLAISTDLRIKRKDIEKRDKYRDLARGLKKYNRTLK